MDCPYFDSKHLSHRFMTDLLTEFNRGAPWAPFCLGGGGSFPDSRVLHKKIKTHVRDGSRQGYLFNCISKVLMEIMICLIKKYGSIYNVLVMRALGFGFFPERRWDGGGGGGCSTIKLLHVLHFAQNRFNQIQQNKIRLSIGLPGTGHLVKPWKTTISPRFSTRCFLFTGAD